MVGKRQEGGYCFRNRLKEVWLARLKETKIKVSWGTRNNEGQPAKKKKRNLSN
jgi:hypothetical protein